MLKAAIGVFAERGYSAATMEAIAAAANLTKPTLYRHFSGKDTLFKAMMEVPRDAMLQAAKAPKGSGIVDQLFRFAWVYADTVMSPEYLAFARLIIGEAQRFPEIGRAYQASGPDQVLAGLTGVMQAARQAGQLDFEDAELAAQDFWGLILSAPRNRALHDPDAVQTRSEIARYVNNGLRVFLRAYSTRPAEDLAQLEDLIFAYTQQASHRHPSG